MKKRKIVALVLAVMLPLTCYLIVSSLSEEAVVMPKRYFFDTVLTVTRNGKQVSDTQWHKIKKVTLTNQFGHNASLQDWEGKIIVADFFFTSCPQICPAMTRNMKRLQDAFRKTDTIVRFVSFTVDPIRDTAAKLKAYGDRYGVDHDTWMFLTGPKQEIYDLALNEFKASIGQEGEIDTAFIHTDRLFLLDKDLVVRGWYDGRDSANLDRVIKDVVLLNMERDKKKKRNLFRK